MMICDACDPFATTARQVGCPDARNGEFCTTCSAPVFTVTFSPVTVLPRPLDT